MNVTNRILLRIERDDYILLKVCGLKIYAIQMMLKEIGSIGYIAKHLLITCPNNIKYMYALFIPWLYRYCGR